MAAVIAAAAERVRRGRRLRQAVERQRKQRKEMRHRAAVAAKKAANLASALSPKAASPHLDIISDNSKGNRAQGDSGTPNSGGSATSLTAAATSVNHGHGAAPLPLSGPEMDFDAPRFCFIHLWAELLLTYSEFLQPDDREARKKQKRRRRERRRKHRRHKKRTNRKLVMEGWWAQTILQVAAPLPETTRRLPKIWTTKSCIASTAMALKARRLTGDLSFEDF